MFEVSEDKFSIHILALFSAKNAICSFCSCNGALTSYAADTLHRYFFREYLQVMKQVFTNPPYMNLFFTIGEKTLNYIYLIIPFIVLSSKSFFMSSAKTLGHIGHLPVLSLSLSSLCVADRGFAQSHSR
jgi:hypothetical protein